MTATNHAITGSIIGLLIGNPLLALPLAFLSHFICDALPHFGSSLPFNIYVKTRRFRNSLIVDGAMCIILVSVLAISQPQHWIIAGICAFLATSPDLFWINEFRLMRAGKAWYPNVYSRFAARIQWFEKPIGGVVEVAWLLAGVITLRMLLA